MLLVDTGSKLVNSGEAGPAVSANDTVGSAASVTIIAASAIAIFLYIFSFVCKFISSLD
jgi:hypothetical protein